MQLAKDLGIDERVLFLGVRLDVQQLIKTADVVVLASHYEGMSLSAIEAMASSKPFVASNVRGLSGMVKDAGLLFEDGNHQELAKQIALLLSDATFYQTVAANCQTRAASFDIARMVSQYIALYKNGE